MVQKKLLKKPASMKVEPEDTFTTVQEVAIYLHRFHNLDLFQQGWYQIKISMKWENDDNTSLGTPARVVQYEAPNLGYDDIFGVWRINDRDNTFSTQPFWIKYARQDILLSILISFSLSPSKYEGPSTSAVILKFELMYAAISEIGSELQASLDACPAAVHEFRIPPKALLGLHSYCPVHFDAFHAVLVDVSIHVSLQKAGSHTSALKVSSDSCKAEDAAGGIVNTSDQALGQVASADTKPVMLVKALLDSRNTLLEDLQKLSGAINQAIDMTEFISGIDAIKLSHPILQVNISEQGKPQNRFEHANGSLDFQRDLLLCTLSEENLLKIFDFLGNQVSCLWNMFLNFHRATNKKILKYLRDAWAKDRRAEWSIWMVYSKVEMPHHYLNSGLDEPPHNVTCIKVSVAESGIFFCSTQPAQLAAMRAELHRRSIAQMKINNRFIQDMHIFGNPSRIPIVIVERVMNAPRRTFSENSYFRNVDLIGERGSQAGPSSKSGKQLSGVSPPQHGRDLKVVVFVHGFQGHHLDLRLIRNQWLLLDPKIEFLMSEVNQERTSGDLRQMGLRLAQEVIAFLKKKMDKVSRSVGLRDIKLSFVGHSIGNIILRTALAESIMEPYLRYLYTYVSISGPHLGYLYSSNSLFNSGLWLLKKLKNTQCIHQLTLTDNPDLQHTFFYKLSKQKTLENFRHIILLSSPQDGYVPYHSARIELCQAASWDYSKKGKVFLEMLNNCLDQIRAPSSEQRVFLRCDVNFDTTTYGKNFNTIIGRAAHIEFLESDIYAKFIMWSFPEIFQ
ncbi:protein FAM135B-like isoform X1 [Pistacia vera]|uniref:protein FAM135B-like isoform X1 n=1 Tax=Pistacia vera TaxID=55513 RepID=UPI0012639C0C|nr:protein FAM135B-like isoform X1 [Pistacia vera]